MRKKENIKERTASVTVEEKEVDENNVEEQKVEE